VELGAHGVSVGVVDVGEDGQGLLPGGAGRLVVAGGVVRVAEVGERVGFEGAVADVPVQGEGVLVAGEGLLVVAEQCVEPDDRVKCGSVATGPATAGSWTRRT
jgi:hypothetical protein